MTEVDLKENHKFHKLIPDFFLFWYVIPYVFKKILMEAHHNLHVKL
jgi:hypothetical protein